MKTAPWTIPVVGFVAPWRILSRVSMMFCEVSKEYLDVRNILGRSFVVSAVSGRSVAVLCYSL